MSDGNRSRSGVGGSVAVGRNHGNDVIACVQCGRVQGIGVTHVGTTGPAGIRRTDIRTAKAVGRGSHDGPIDLDLHTADRGPHCGGVVYRPSKLAKRLDRGDTRVPTINARYSLGVVNSKTFPACLR
jgi:hypothetical protein